MLRATTKLNVLRAPLLRRSLSSSADAPVLREVRGAVGLLTLNRPKALNALSPDLVASLVEERQIDVLFCDFARTLCTTKSGASPLQSKRVTHSIDADLAAAAALARRAYVVTRNSHRADILTFLAAQGARFDDVVVVQKKKSKATEIAPRLAPGERGRFVDDDVRECCDPKVAAVPGLTRVLYARGS